MLDERDPIYRAALAPYQELVAAHEAAVERIDEEFTAKAEEFERYREQRDKEDAAKQEQIAKSVSDARAAFEKANPKAKNAWALPAREPENIAFGQIEDDEDQEPAKVSAPAPWTPPRAAPPESTDARAGRHAKPANDFDEDDFSSNNWLR
ncbi:MAG: hypothetical protein ACRDQ7_00585 [Haloechinothrix sp.]